ncbi:glucan biosynthesis protein [Amaricoccus sp.]|uniref:glucan biosynthesis protein n=1 Tax=Amaricoccus sp. TaxID=1872485 RepID=UPI001B5BE386|nr:glucan biosynthesis protein G [Amaricoccus sp.]MBP7002808.1 glucan biosynthesis protein [Amaricoccus sp.]
MHRRSLLGSLLAGLFGGALPRLVTPALAQETPFSFDTVIARARAAAAAPFAEPGMALTAPFADLPYDAYRGIRFRDEARVFAGGGFQMDLLPPGFHYDDRVEISVVSAGAARPLAFSADLFSFDPAYFPWPDGRAPAGLAQDLGFSGFRLRHPINRPDVWDEFAVFQGASYFRAVARDTLYGLSARGLAIGTAGPVPEEFPLFRSFWIEEPAPGATTLKLYALLDGPSVAGAYAFAITPGAETVMEIDARLFPRVDINAAGIAPLTSMYFFGPESRRGIDDFRDALHDSCGLWMITGAGERLWRPLRNPQKLEISAFADVDPQAFGLVQRFRDFEHYQDAETRYEERPSAWIEPAGGWGAGLVTLIEIPTTDETNDNIVAFWRPQEPLRAGQERAYAYRLVWAPLPDDALPLARVAATRTGRSIMAPHLDRVFVVDFDLGQIDVATVTPKLEATAGVATELSVGPLPGGNLARVSFRFAPNGAAQTEFRLRLESAGRPASETWLYRWSA